MKMKYIIIFAILMNACVLAIFIPGWMKQAQKIDIQVGDSFVVTMTDEDPFIEPYIIQGRVLDKKGDYVQYKNSAGYVTSMNIQSYARYWDVIIVKEE